MENTSIYGNVVRPSNLEKAQKGASISKVKKQTAEQAQTMREWGANIATTRQSNKEIRKAKQRQTCNSVEQHVKDAGSKIKDCGRAVALHKEDEKGGFTPKTWFFWRGVLMYIFLFSIVGHWLEIPYCLAMHEMFGIVEPDYAMWTDPWWVPYWVYGAGATVLTFTMLPLKIQLMKRCKNMGVAILAFLVLAVVLCAAMECVMGWICNQPDEFGKYPFWDNSQLPGNIFGQAWIVNDVALAFVSLAYVWVLFPFCQKVMRVIGEKAANVTFVLCCVACAVVCITWYVPQVMGFA